MRGASRPAASAAAPISGVDVRRDRLRVGHPEDGAVGDRTRDAQQPASERGDEHRHRDAFGGGGSTEVNVEVVADELHRFAVQQLARIVTYSSV